MPWKVVTTTELVHTGRPDASIGKIILEDGTQLVITDYWPHYPARSMQLHPDFMPAEIVALIDQVYDDVLKEIDDVERSGVVAQINAEKAKLGGKVYITVRFGSWSNPQQTYTYPSPIVELIGSAD